MPESTADLSSARAYTPMAFVRCIVLAYEQRGMDPTAALEQGHIAPDQLHAPGACISARQLELLSAAAMRELDDEALGWFERRLPWGSYGMLVRASLSAPTLGLALARWCRHHQLLTTAIGLQLHADGALARLELTERRDLGPMREFCLVSVLRNALGVACWLGDSRIALRGTTLRFGAPPHHAAYQVLFDGPCSFGAATNSLLFDARYLALPLRRDEAALQRMLPRALQLLVRPYRRDRLLVEQVRQALAADPQRCRTAQALAQQLHLSERTLHRQLRQEGSSLQQLRDAVRREHAVHWLQRSTRSVKHIAQTLGFQSDKSFIRAFRHWTGQTPDQFRKT